MTIPSSLDPKFAEYGWDQMRANWNDLVDTMPRWTARLSQQDRDNLLQALHDLDQLLGWTRNVRPEDTIERPHRTGALPAPPETTE